MAGDAVRIVPLPRSASTTPIIERLIAGAILRGRVLNTPAGVSVALQGANLPLTLPDPPPNGAAVEVRYNVQSGNVEIYPLPNTAPGPSRAPAALSPLIQAVLNALPANTTPAVAQALIPAFVPLKRTDVESLVRLMHVRSSLGPEVARLATILDTAGELTSLSPQTAATLRELDRLSRARTADEFVQLVRAAQRGSRPMESILAAWVARDSTDEFSLVLELSRLRGDRAFRAALSQLGLLAEFESLVDGVVERQQAAKLQALHGREQTYQFLDIPVQPDTGMRHLAMHVFPDGNHDQSLDATKRARTDRVVMDLSMSHLGNLWIVLQRSGDRCACCIHADSPEVVTTLNQQGNSLADALRGIGFEATVTAEAWDGDRLVELARALDSASGLDARG